MLTLVLSAPLAIAHPGGVDKDGCHRNAKSNKRHCHPEPPVYDVAHPPRVGDEGVFYGPLDRVTDGDSLFVKVQGVVMEFRLAEIDAPEYDQPYGSEARRALIGLIQGRPLVIAPFDTDSYGRTVAHIWVGDLQLNRELVKRGAAWFLSDYTRDESLYHIEQEARTAKRGLWGLPLKDRMEPWEWRKRKRAIRRNGG
ncbi:MAG: thermonuclease family protein [Steroidobacter sp.]